MNRQWKLAARPVGLVKRSDFVFTDAPDGDPLLVPLRVAWDREKVEGRRENYQSTIHGRDHITYVEIAAKKDGTVTAANASKINDGAAALLVMAKEKAAALGLTPLARIVAASSAAKKPEQFTTAPADVIPKVLAKAGLSLAEIDLFEINEAFAVVNLAVQGKLGIDHAKVNVHGGAVALGHPIGASGARILVTLLHAMRRQNVRRGLGAICIGGGEASGIILER